ncbi:MAG TPA: PolC-type DNA polymerase III [Clostridiaceae bacterium]|nr:PolC-type DNA polymerase III [Clostridiaceae bacterium]
MSTSGEIFNILNNIDINTVNIYKNSDLLEICASTGEIIEFSTICNIEDRLAEKLGFNNVRVKLRFNVNSSLQEIVERFKDGILFNVNHRVAVSRGILDNSSWEVHDNRLFIKLRGKGSEILESLGCNRLIEELIRDSFSYNVKVKFVDSSDTETMVNEYINLVKKEESRALNEISTNNNGLKKDSKNSNGEKTPTEIILGKDFKDDIVKMQEVNSNSGRVAICGDIFSVEFKELRGGRYLCTFDITDRTSSLTVKCFADKDKLGILQEKIKENKRVKVRGEVQYDKFSREICIFAYDIIETEKNIKEDKAEEKRVELHMHTQMSALDAVTPVKDLISRASAWGHKAVAITDHGVVQAYPDAYEAAKKNNIKVIYGIECYIVNDQMSIVSNPRDYLLDDAFVVFDIETTGLNAVNDKIIEIAAVMIKEGEIIDTFQSLINPDINISEFITRLTGISNDMVKDSPGIAEVLKNFLDFVGDLPVVAHNAPFDTGFIINKAKEIGRPFTNPIIDTLQLCRCLFPELERHKLDIVAKHLGISLDNHHRALDDATATAHIFIKCLNILKDRGLTTIKDIQRAFSSNTNYTKTSSYHAVILAKNQTGLKNLYKLVSVSHLKYFYKRPLIPKSVLSSHREGLILGSACEAGELYSAIVNNKGEEEISEIVKYYDYLEIQPLGNNEFLIANQKVKNFEELKNINRKIVELGKKHDKPVVATCDVHFMDPEDEVFRRILMAGQGYEDADRQAPLYFRTTDEMLKEFSYLGEEEAYNVVVGNTNKIADMIDVLAPVPEGTFPPKMEGAADEIKIMAEERAKEIYGYPLPEIVEQRLEKELNSIIKNGFSVMYLIAQKLVAKSLSDGYLVGSRGSVGSSFVAYMVGITEVNSLQPHYVCPRCKYSEFITDGSYECGFDLPDKECPRCGQQLKKDGYDIPFETFLGFDGDKEPDIDLNFSGKYQPVAHKYVEELFGKGHVFRAGTIATVAEKTAYGFVKNYLEERGIAVTNAEMNRLIKGCTGIKRTTGQHPGGIMIVPNDKEIYDFSPIQRPADDTSSNVITTHFDYHFLHGSILKLDILGHDDPTVIRMLEDLTGVKAQTIPIGEKATMSIFSSTEALGIKPEDINSEVGTFGIPEFGTKFVRQMLVDTKPKTFSELIRISGLSHGTDVWLNNAQDIIREGIATLSECICCRDDIMLFLIHSGLPSKTAFKIMEDVRKGKGLKEEYVEIMKEKGVPQWYIDSCNKIKYMFPKAHAAAYVMMAFRIAWFKVYYPEAFYATYFTVRADDFDAELMAYGQDKVKNAINELEKKGNEMTQKEKNVLTILEVVNEMYARGIKFLPVHLYKSDATEFRIYPDGIRPPLTALQGLGSAAAQNICEARMNGEFLSKEDLRTRAKLSKTVIEILEQHGCLEDLPESNQLSWI